jgi:hypothetical protein
VFSVVRVKRLGPPPSSDPFDSLAGELPPRGQVFDDFATFVALVHKQLPTTRIIYLPIKPSVARWQKWPQMQQANALVADLARNDNHLEIVDTATPLLGHDGKPRPDIFQGDGLHMNAKGYAIWNQILTPVLKQARNALTARPLSGGLAPRDTRRLRCAVRAQLNIGNVPQPDKMSSNVGSMRLARCA